MSRAVRPLTPYPQLVSAIGHLAAHRMRTSSAETGVGAPGALIVLSSYCSSSALILSGLYKEAKVEGVVDF